MAITEIRYVLIVVRSGGEKYEIIHDLYGTEDDAKRSQEYFAQKWRGVELKVAPITITF